MKQSNTYQVIPDKIIKSSELLSNHSNYIFTLRITSEHTSIYPSAQHTLLFNFNGGAFGVESYELSIEELHCILKANLEPQKP